MIKKGIYKYILFSMVLNTVTFVFIYRLKIIYNVIVIYYYQNYSIVYYRLKKYNFIIMVLVYIFFKLKLDYNDIL
jgi:hypothetical protein